MSPGPTRFVVPFTHFAAFLFGAGLLAGGVLFLFDAPIWAYYVAPLGGVPFLIWALLRQDELEMVEAARRRNAGDNPGYVGSRSRVTGAGPARINPSLLYRWDLGRTRSMIVASVSILISLGGIGALMFLVKTIGSDGLAATLIAIAITGVTSLGAVLLRTLQVHRMRQHEHRFGHSPHSH